MVSWSLIWAPELLFVPSSPLSPRQVYGHCEEQLESCLNASCSQEQRLQPRDTAEPMGPEHFKAFQLAAPNLPKTLPMWSGHSQRDQTTPFSSTSLEDSNAFFSRICKRSHVPFLGLIKLLWRSFPSCLFMLSHLHRLVLACQTQGKCLTSALKPLVPYSKSHSPFACWLLLPGGYFQTKTFALPSIFSFLPKNFHK